MNIFTVAEMIEAERLADEAGHSYAQMMELAGRGVAEAIMARQDVTDRAVFVLAGKGNNGGDALVAGRHLAQAGAKVVVYLAQDRPEDDPHLQKIQELDVSVLHAKYDQRFRVLRLRLTGAEIVIDGIFGTGITRPITGDTALLLRQVRAGLDVYARLVAEEQHTAERGDEKAVSLQSVNQVGWSDKPAPQRPYVVAIDCPSGLNCDTGEADPLTLEADLTVTFAGPKHGHFLFPGAAVCGELVVADIGIGLEHQTQTTAEVVTPMMAKSLLPKRPLDGHKGTFGRILIAAGSAEYRGAPILAAKGAFRAGAGLVALALPEVVRETAVSQLPEATYPPISADEVLDHTAEQELFTTLSQYKAVLLGPGIGQAESFVMSFLTELSQSDRDALPAVVLDADALNVLSQRDDWPHLMNENMILTPHPGEMARLMGMPLTTLKGMNRLMMAQVRAQEWGCVVVLKGAYTVIAAPDGRCRVLPFSNPILGTAGSGDVLAGVITALLGQGVQPYDAAVCGAYLHGLAGDFAREKWGDAGLLAREIADYVPLARKRLLLHT